MKVKDVLQALKSGERHFKNWALEEPVEVLDWGKTWVDYKTPSMKMFISTNIKTFALSLDNVYKPPD